MSPVSVYLLLSCSIIYAIDIIDRIWTDDLLYDATGLNGWNTYYGSQNVYTPNVNPITIASLADYHGIYEGNDNYLIRTFQCKNDSSVSIAFNMAYCGNEAGDSTQVYLDNNLKFTIDLDSPERLHLLNDALITSAITCSDDYYLYYSYINSQQINAFVNGKTSFVVEIEVSLSLSDDLAAINNITIVCDPITPSPVSAGCIPSTPSPSNLIWNDDFLYDGNGNNGWNIYYIDSVSEELYTPNINPLVCGTYNLYHGIYNTNDRKHFLSRNFQCKYDSNVLVQYSVAHCGNGAGDEINLYFDNNEVSSISLEQENTFNDIILMSADNGECTDSWSYSNFVTAVNTVVQYTTFQIKFELIFSLDREHAALYNIDIICNHSFTETTITPTTQFPTTFAPNTQFPTTMTPTTSAPNTQFPTTQFPTTSAPNTLFPTTSAPNTQFPTTMTPTTSAPNTQFPTTFAPSTMIPVTNVPTNNVVTTLMPITMTPTITSQTTYSPTISTFTPIRSPLSPTSNKPTLMLITAAIPKTSTISDATGDTMLTSTMNIMKNKGKNNTNKLDENMIIIIIISILSCIILVMFCCVCMIRKKRGKETVKKQKQDSMEMERVNSSSQIQTTSNYVSNEGHNTNNISGINTDYAQFKTPPLGSKIPNFVPETMDINLAETENNQHECTDSDKENDDLWATGTCNVTKGGDISHNATPMGEQTDNLDGLYSKPSSQQSEQTPM